MGNLQEQFIEYTQIISDIRRLSSVTSADVENVDAYSRKLKDNFFRIGEISARSRAIAEDVIRPLLRKKEQLTAEEVEALYVLCDRLLDPFSEEELDLDVLDEASYRLLVDAREKGEDNAIIHAMYVYINSCYANMIRTNRIRVDESLSKKYRDAGVATADAMMQYLAQSAFEHITEESRRYVLIHSRFYLALYDTFYVDEDINEKRLSGLWRSFDLSEDAFYTDLTPNYDWNYHRIRCLENMGQLTERGNAWQFSEKQIVRIYDGVLQLAKIWKRDPQKNEVILPKVQLDLLCIRNAYFAGKMSKDAYEDALMERYKTWSNQCYDSYSLVGNILVPAELLAVVDHSTLSEKKAVFIEKMYYQIVDYIQHSTNTEAFYFLLDYLTGFLEVFVELPGCITFEEMTLSCLAAIHPPTYVHSLQVAQISRCLGRHLYARKPELFGNRSIFEILDLIYHSALCHDFGKIAMLDTIFVYGRPLSDLEFSVIKTHPAMSTYMLKPYSSTASMSTIVAAHHIWKNREAGYKLGVSVPEEDQVIVDILSIADSIDAATDVVGRNYSKSKRLDEIVAEIQSLKGTRYSKEVVDLFYDVAIMEELDFLIHEGRNLNYRNTYVLLFKNAGDKE